MSYEELKADARRQSLQTWERMRVRGRRRFIWIHGVLEWGGLMALGLCLGAIIAGRQFAVVLATTILSLIGGYLIGEIKWKSNEKIYHASHGEEII